MVAPVRQKCGKAHPCKSRSYLSDGQLQVLRMHHLLAAAPKMLAQSIDFWAKETSKTKSQV